MSCSKFRGEYTELQQIATTFQNQSEAVGKTIQDLSSKVQNLQGGKNWEGDNANKFYEEWNNTVQPSLKRLQNALNQAGSATKQISAKVKEAEEQSSSVFVIVINN